MKFRFWFSLILVFFILFPVILAISTVQNTIDGNKVTLTYKGTPPFYINIRPDKDIGQDGGYFWAKTNLDTFTLDVSFAINPSKKFYYGVKDTKWSKIDTFTIANNKLADNVFVVMADNTTLSPLGEVQTTVVTKKFYKNNPDKFDFLAILTAFPSNNDYDFANKIKSDIKGLGPCIGIYDSSLGYGSSGKLRGTVVIHDIDQYTNTTGDLLHELSHFWLMYVCNIDEDKSLWISPGGGHWSPFVDTSVRIDGKVYMSPNGGNPWRDNGDGTFSVDTKDVPSVSGSSVGWLRFNSIELYLMGFLPKSEAKPIYMIVTNYTNIQNLSPPISGWKKTIYIDDIVKIAGEREPSFPNTQRNFNVAFILLTRNGKEPTDDQISKINWIANNFPMEWSIATQNKSSINQ